jgi:hypothetical protein
MIIGNRASDVGLVGWYKGAINGGLERVADPSLLFFTRARACIGCLSTSYNPPQDEGDAPGQATGPAGPPEEQIAPGRASGGTNSPRQGLRSNKQRPKGASEQARAPGRACGATNKRAQQVPNAERAPAGPPEEPTTTNGSSHDGTEWYLTARSDPTPDPTSNNS